MKAVKEEKNKYVAHCDKWLQLSMESIPSPGCIAQVMLSLDSSVIYATPEYRAVKRRMLQMDPVSQDSLKSYWVQVKRSDRDCRVSQK